jgi:pimeloyl-ACP methyl ester carboxylesterase
MHKLAGHGLSDNARRMISWVAALALLLPLLAGCGAQTAVAPTQTPAPANTPAPTATPPPAEAPTAEPTATPEPSPAPQARFESGPCPFDLPAGQVEGETVECGTLSVPEDRSDPQSRTLRLPVAVFHPSGTAQPDPIVYLEGGPGGSALEFLNLKFGQQFEPLLAAGRDLVIFDQRGVGYSKPDLDCPEARELGLEMMDLEVDGTKITEEEALARVDEALLACGEDLAGSTDLADYHTTASAADVNDLRAALGYDQVNLWGTSYGTWLALEVLRSYPEAVRSVVLDSVLPPDVDLVTAAPGNGDRAFRLLYDACAADAACNAAYPDLHQVLLDTAKRLNETPAELQVTDPLAGKTYPVEVTGDDLVAMVFQFLYATEIIPSLPQIIYDASQGSFTVLTQLIGALIAQSTALSRGQQLSVLCHDEIPFDSPQELEAALAQYPEMAPSLDDSILGRMGFRLCPEWGAGQAGPELEQPVTSDVPTLVMSGQYDPITPPAWGQRAAETLTNGYFFEYPGVGHGASTVEGCPQQMMVAFLQDPTRAPDSACVAAMEAPRFSVPTEGTAVEMVPFTDAQLGIQGVAPQGWTQQNPGVFVRGSSATDLAVLIEQGTPGTAQDLLNLLSQQLGLAEAPESSGQREANGITWNLYSAQVGGLSIEFALGESGGLALVVLLQSDPREHDALVEAAYLPAIDALVPLKQ